jgi:GTP cyclohydrolase I
MNQNSSPTPEPNGTTAPTDLPSEAKQTDCTPDLEPVKSAFVDFIEALNLNGDSEHLDETPRRVAESRVEELFAGLWVDPRRHLETTFDSDGSHEMVIVDGIDVASMCAHHFLPFRGQAHIGYVPGDEIVGLSKFSRVVDDYARRPQVQERLTTQIADAVDEELDPQAVIVCLEAEHECMALRGVQEPNAMTRTSALRGKAREDPALREEFFDLVKGVSADE